MVQATTRRRVAQVKDSLILITLLVELGVAAAYAGACGPLHRLQEPAAESAPHPHARP